MDQVLWWLYLSDLAKVLEIVIGFGAPLAIVMYCIADNTFAWRSWAAVGVLIAGFLIPNPVIFKLRGLNLLYTTQSPETCLEVSKIYDRSIKCPVPSPK